MERAQLLSFHLVEAAYKNASCSSASPQIENLILYAMIQPSNSYSIYFACLEEYNEISFAGKNTYLELKYVHTKAVCYV